MDFAKFFVEHRNYFLAGRGEIAVIGTLGTYFALGSLWLKEFLPGNEQAQTILAIVTGLVFIGGSWFLGWLYDKTKVYHAMNEFNNIRNPFVERMDKIEIQITELKELIMREKNV